jgi:hypothetical protein
MRLPLLVIGTISALVGKALNFAADFLCEESIRMRQDKIRKIQARKMEEWEKSERTGRKIANERKRRRYLRRGALMTYHTAQRDLILVALDALDEAKRVGYNRLKTVQKRMTARDRSFIDPSLFIQFCSLRDAVHAEIKESKSLTCLLKERLQHINTDICSLGDVATHNKIGSKKQVLALLEELHNEGRKWLASKDAKNSALRLNAISYVLEEQCPSCRAWLSPAMVYCPLCGDARKDVLPVRFLKKDAVAGASCLACQAPTVDLLRYCFNCGQEQDPSGLRSAVKC